MGDTTLREALVRDPTLLVELRDLTTHLRSALDRFRLDSRLVDLAEKEIPDARARLNHVLTLTNDAAHRTLDLIEQSCPAADRTAREAAALVEAWSRFRARNISVSEFQDLVGRIETFLTNVRQDTETVRANLAEMLLAQGYQDLTGQIIRGVINLVGEVENALGELARLQHGAPAPAAKRPSQGFGPQVPGVDDAAAAVSGQQDVDALLSDLGV